MALPVSALGNEYIIGHYVALKNYTNMQRTNPVIGIVATEDDTSIEIDASMDIFPAEYERVKVGSLFNITLNKGDVYNLEARASNLADLTGSIIKSNKPISVLGQHPCAFIPQGVSACDHLVEQLPPIESLSTEYITTPFWGRSENRFGDSGDYFRVIAPFDETLVYIDGVYKAKLGKKQYFEFFSNDAQHIKTSHPVMVMQYMAGQNLDGGYGGTPALVEADPAMVVVTPVEQYLKSYLVNTPAYTIDRNFINVVIATSAVGSVQLNGNSVDTSLFTEVPGTEYSFAQIEIETGSHFLEASEPMGMYNYGYARYESYAYSGGMAFSLPGDVASLDLSSSDGSASIGESLCVMATTVDSEGKPAAGVRVAFATTGENEDFDYVMTDSVGESTFCYSGLNSGVDTITATVMELISTLDVTWTEAIENQAPVITSMPSLLTTSEASYSYQVEAFDPEGEELTFQLVDPAYNMSIDANGLLSYPRVTWTTAGSFGGHTDIVVEISDESGNKTLQKFALRNDRPYNLPPEFVVSTPNANAIVGVPYVYNADYLDFRVRGYTHRLEVADQFIWSPWKLDAVYAELVSGPDGAAITREDDGWPYLAKLDCTGCLHYLNWIPQNDGEFEFDIALSDSRGGKVDNQTFTVNVQPNQPPEIITSEFPNTASVGQEYVVVIDIENDVPLGRYENFDDLQIVFEQGPSAMRALKLDGVYHQTNKFYISWTPTSNDLGENQIRFRVDDRLNSSVSSAYTITVVDDNSAPEITSRGVPDAEVSIPYSYQVEAIDPDGDNLSYKLLLAPEGMSVSDTGLITWTALERDLVEEPPAYTRFIVWVEVSDSKGGSDIEKYYLSLDEFYNRAPEFVPSYHPLIAKVGVPFVHQVVATDREGNYPLEYILSSSSSEPTIDTSTGVITWVPGHAGRYWLNAMVRDSEGRYASANNEFWYVDVVESSESLDAELSLINKPLTTAFVGQAYQYRFFGESSLGGNVVASLVNAPQGMTITPNQPYEGAYEINWMPDEADCVHDVEIVLMDEYGNSQPVHYSIDVHNAPKKLNRFQCSLDNELCAAP
ncbi:hypothetical protein [Oleiphilus sp. HI0117]|uniref:hypothetical protein n=1 Tax=Oleiphilus sp. HI0117 TaxID=1822261 RepID=UPI0018D4CD56|nr:hypothetical protein [Oleiphilus sp. HI0117]